MLKSLWRIFFIICGIDVLVFVIGYFTPINDTKPTFADDLVVLGDILFLPLLLSIVETHFLQVARPNF